MIDFDRDWMAEHMPDNGVLRKLAADIAGSAELEVQLLWLAQTVEGDRFPRPPWKDDLEGSGRAEIVWGLRADGLEYKTSMHYLTAEGWPLGTTCWFVRVDCGWPEFICGETPGLALARAVIFITTAIIWRDSAPPKERLELTDMVSAACIGARTARDLEAING